MSFNPFDLAEKQYKTQQKPIKSSQTNPFDAAQKQLTQKYPFDEENDLDREIERQQARMTSRGLESVAGAPGDLLSFALSLFGKKQDILPTSESLKAKSQELSQGYTSPQNELEQFGDELISDVASFALPGSGTYSMVRNLGIPIAANLIKEGVKYATKDEKDAAYGKLGSMVVLDLLAHRKGLGGGAKEFAGNLFRQAEEAIPKGQSIKAANLESALGRLESTLTMGGERPSTKDALKKVSEIRSEIKNGKIDVKRLSAYRPAINELIDTFGGFEMQLPKKVKAKAIRELNQVKGSVIENLNDYGKKFNPEFYKYNTSANEAWAAYENSNKIANFVKKHAGNALKSTSAKVLLGIPAAGVAKAAAGTSATAAGLGAAGAAGLSGIYEAFKVLNRMKNSKTLRTHYNNILKGALKGNISMVTKNAKALDKELEDQ